MIKSIILAALICAASPAVRAQDSATKTSSCESIAISELDRRDAPGFDLGPKAWVTIALAPKVTDECLITIGKALHKSEPATHFFFKELTEAEIVHLQECRQANRPGMPIAGDCIDSLAPFAFKRNIAEIEPASFGRYERSWVMWTGSKLLGHWIAPAEFVPER